MKTFSITLLCLLIWQSPYCQDSGLQISENINVDSECNPVYDVLIEFEDSENPDWELPYEVDVEFEFDDTEAYYLMDSPSLTIPGLEPGEYNILIYLDEDCTTSFDLTLEPFVIDELVTATVTETDCDDSGSIILHLENLPEPTTVLWENGNTNPARTGLSQGEYTVDITLGDGCTIQKEYIIGESTQLIFTGIIQSTNTSSCIESDGVLYMKYFSVIGGTPPYSHIWSNGETGSLYDLSAGDYTLIISDSNGCQLEENYQIEGSGQPIIANMDVQPTCEGFSKGWIEIFAAQEVGPLQIVWQNGETVTSDDNYFFERRENLAPGEYCYTLTDLGNGCFVEGCETIDIITEYEEFEVSTNVKHDCDSGGTGSISAHGFHGVGEKYYLWSTGETSETIDNLNAGNYWVKVSDDCNNSITKHITVLNKTPEFQVDAKIKCVSDETGIGSISLEVSGANPPFSYYWVDTPFSHKNITIGSPGTYTVRIRDKFGCTYEESYEVGTTPGGLNAIVVFNETTNCEDKLIITAKAIVTGGVPPYTYKWTARKHPIDLPNTEEVILDNLIQSSRKISEEYRVEILDACGYSTVSSFQEVTCTDFCDESDCFVFRWEDAGNDCIDFCDDKLSLGIEWECDQLYLEPQCDDGIRRTVFWNTSGGGVSVFEGDELIDGKDEEDINQGAFGLNRVYVRNEITGCGFELRVILPVHSGPCFNLWEWLIKTFPGGPGGPSGTPCNWTEVTEGCTIHHICEHDQSLNFSETSSLEQCWSARIEEGQDDLGNPIITHAVREFCPLNCDLIGPSILVEGEVPTGMLACEDCDNFQNPNDEPECNKKILSIIYDSEANSFWGLSTSNTDSVKVQKLGNINNPQSLDSTFFILDEVELLDMKTKSDTEILSILKDRDNNLIIKYDQLIQKATWHQSVGVSNYIASYIKQDGLIVVTQDENGLYSSSKFGKQAGQLMSDIRQSNKPYYSINGDSKIEQNGNVITLYNSNGTVNFSIAQNQYIHSFFETNTNEYIIFYNYEKIDPQPRQRYGFGYIVYNSLNQNLESTNLGFQSSSVITKTAYDINMNFALSISYSEFDNVSIQNFSNQEINCFEYVFINISENNSLRSTVTSSLIEVYPNPTQDVINIELNNENYTIDKIKLYNDKGKLFLSQNKLGTSYQMNFSDQGFPSGIYFVEISLTNGKTYLKKLVKI